MLKIIQVFVLVIVGSFVFSKAAYARPLDKCAIVTGMWEGPNTAVGPWKVGFIVRTLSLNPTTRHWEKDANADGLRSVMAAQYIAHFTPPSTVIYPVNLYQYDMMKLAFQNVAGNSIICINKDSAISYPTHYLHLVNTPFPIN